MTPIHRASALACLFIAGLGYQPLPALAADASNGKTLYTNSSIAGTACSNSNCHGTLPGTKNKIQAGANSPSTILSAINSGTGGMGIYRNKLSSANLDDIAAYIGNPNLTATGSVSPSSLSFASTSVGSSSASQTVTLSNSGTVSLSVSAISIASSDFAIVGGGSCSAGSNVAIGSSCTVLTQFQPTASGARSGTLSFTTGAGTKSVALSGTGAAASAPTAQISPSSLSFTATVGQTASAQTVTLSNTGTATLTLSSLALSGTAAGDYSIASGTTCSSGGSIAAGSSCIVRIDFSPSASGTRSASLSITHNDSSHSPSTVSLSGTGSVAASGQLSVNASSLSFAAQAQGTTSNAKSVTVSNSGSAAVQFSGLSLSGSNAGDFALTSPSGACTASSLLAVGASCTISVTFTPSTSSGTRSASVRIVSDAINTPVTISLSGTAGAASTPLPAFSPSTLDFGSVGVGSTAATQTISLSNNGTASLSISSLSVSPSDYTLSHDCGTSVAAGSSCTLQIGFTPSSAGSIAGTLSLSSNASGSPLTAALSGSGVAGSASLSWSPDTLSFSSTDVGSRSAALSATLSNTGSGAASLSAVGLAGSNASEFVIDSNSCTAGSSLAPGASCSVAILFAPSAAGSRSAQLSLSLSSGTAPPLNLSGTGVASGSPLLTVSSSSITLSSLPNQALQPQALVISNEGAAVLTVSSYLIPPSLTLQSGDCTSTPYTLQPGASCTVMVAPASDGSIDAQLQIRSNSSGGTVTVTVSGTPNTNVGGGGALLLGRYDTPLHAALSLLLLSAMLLARRRIPLRREPRTHS